jgi:hypothetical protein
MPESKSCIASMPWDDKVPMVDPFISARMADPLLAQEERRTVAIEKASKAVVMAAEAFQQLSLALSVTALSGKSLAEILKVAEDV